MNEKYSREDIHYIAEELIEDLRECEYGTVTSTRELAEKAGYDDDLDLLLLDCELMRAAEANQIKLEILPNDGIEDGLPYNAPFIVRNRKAQIRCPRCGSTDTARYIYGYPVFNERMQKKLNEGKIVLGGCLINVAEVNGKKVNLMPERKCNHCHKDFGMPPVLLNRKNGTGEDYRDIIQSIRLSIHEYREGYSEITVTRNENGAVVNANNDSDPLHVLDHKQITVDKWNRIVHALYDRMYLHEWKKEYKTSEVFEDGTEWNLEIRLTNRRVRHYHGSNAFPPYWKELKQLFRGYMRL